MCNYSCRYRSSKKSQHYGGDYCTIVMACVERCPIDSMIRITQDRLDGLLSIREHLQEITVSPQ